MPETTKSILYNGGKTLGKIVFYSSAILVGLTLPYVENPLLVGWLTFLFILTLMAGLESGITIDQS